MRRNYVRPNVARDYTNTDHNRGKKPVERKKPNLNVTEKRRDWNSLDGLVSNTHPIRPADKPPYALPSTTTRPEYPLPVAAPTQTQGTYASPQDASSLDLRLREIGTTGDEPNIVVKELTPFTLYVVPVSPEEYKTARYKSPLTGTSNIGIGYGNEFVSAVHRDTGKDAKAFTNIVEYVKQKLNHPEIMDRLAPGSNYLLTPNPDMETKSIGSIQFP